MYDEKQVMATAAAIRAIATPGKRGPYSAAEISAALAALGQKAESAAAPLRAESPEEELERLRAEVANLKAANNGSLTFRVTDKGSLSVSGGDVGFPVTHFRRKWTALLDAAPKIAAFLRDHPEVTEAPTR